MAQLSPPRRACSVVFFLLLHLARVCVGSTVCSRSTTAGAPIMAPNISSCHLPSGLPSREPPFSCCPPMASYSPRLFVPAAHNSSASLRVRRPSHRVSISYAQKLAEAYSLMKALPADDPRSFLQQANIHCAYCNMAYNQMNSSQLFQVHGSWLFLPFHRWYLYFHERILAKLLNEDTFALSFWNYDHPDGASIPWLYSTSFNDTLVSPLRNPLHNYPNATVAIASPFSGDILPQDMKDRENANAMYRQLVRDASSQQGFFGSALRQGDSPLTSSAGTLESYPHNTIHVWVGNKSAIGMKDMGSFYAAARDPLFYPHHAELDRLWEVWKTIPGHEELLEQDYLNSEFVFYKEDAELVRVKVRDALNTTTLGYVYEEVELPWKDAVPSYESSGPAELTSNDTICREGEPLLAPCSFLMHRDPDAAQESSWLHERLLLDVECSPTGAHLDIYLNLPSASASTGTGCHEYVNGIESLNSFAVLTDIDRYSFTATVDITERLADLNLTEQSYVVVTLVPTFPDTTLVSPTEAFVLLSNSVDVYSIDNYNSRDCNCKSGFSSISAGEDCISK